MAVMPLLCATLLYAGMDKGDKRGCVVGGAELPGLPYSCRIQHHLVHTWYKYIQQAGE